MPNRNIIEKLREMIRINALQKHKYQGLHREKTESEHFIADTIRGRVGERIHSRLKEMCYFENLLGHDRRIAEDELDEDGSE